MRQIADESGEVVFYQAYEPYGEVLVSAGEGGSNYGYAGEWTDASGLQYLRSRYYNTGIGAFLTRDTWAGDYYDPLSLNRWAYVQGNPVRYTDPSGMIICDTVDPVTYLACLNLMDVETLFYNQHESEGYSYSGFAEFYSPKDLYPGYGEYHFTLREMRLIHEALTDIAYAYARAYNSKLIEVLPNNDCSQITNLLNTDVSLGGAISPYDAFSRIHGGRVRFVSKYSENPGWWAEAASSSEIWLYGYSALDSTETKAITQHFARLDRFGDAFLEEAYKRFIVHEMGHVFDNRMGQAPRQEVAATSELINTVNIGFANGFYGPHKDGWQYRLDYQKTKTYEIFADQFIGWVYNKWQVDDDGDLVGMGITRSEFMEENMPRWIRENILLGGD